MTVNLSIKNVREELAKQLRARAQRHHRSLQGELLAILEAAICPAPLSLEEAYRQVRKQGLKTKSESVTMTREDRDGR